MKRLLPGVALAVSIAWGGSTLLTASCGGGAVELPTVELGGAGGTRLMNGTAKTPAEAYDNAYSQLTRAHLNVRRNLEAAARTSTAPARP